MLLFFNIKDCFKFLKSILVVVIKCFEMVSEMRFEID